MKYYFSVLLALYWIISPLPHAWAVAMQASASTVGEHLNAKRDDIFTVSRTGNRTLIRKIIESEGDVNIATKGGKTPLMLAAAENRSPGSIRELVASGALVDAVDDNGLTPLLIAIKENPEPLVTLTLLALGAKTELADAQGRTAIDYALGREDNQSIIDAIQIRSASRREKAGTLNTLLFESVQSGNLDNVTTLLNRGADPNLVTPDGRTLLMFTFQEKCGSAIIATIIRAGADITEVFSPHSPYIVQSVTGGHDVQLLKLLLSLGEDPDTRDSDGNSLLMLACINSNIEGIRTLIQWGADIDGRNPKGETALMFAVRNAPELIDIILEGGADVEIRAYDGKTAPLIAAAERVDLGMMMKLLDRASVSQKDVVYKEAGQAYERAVNERLRLQQEREKAAVAQAERSRRSAPSPTVESRPRVDSSRATSMQWALKGDIASEKAVALYTNPYLRGSRHLYQAAELWEEAARCYRNAGLPDFEREAKFQAGLMRSAAKNAGRR